MIVRIPNRQSLRWTGPYLGNYYGDLYRTFNIDLENDPGHISLSRSFVKVADTTDTNLLNMAVVGAFLRADADCVDRYWGLCVNKRLIRTDTTNPLNLVSATWDEDTLANTPTDARDMTIHENDSDSGTDTLTDTSDSNRGRNVLIVTRDTAIAALNDSASNIWNANWLLHTSPTSLKPGVLHPIEYFPYQRISIIGDGNLIHTIDKNRTATYGRLTLPKYLRVRHIFTTQSRAWILCDGLQGRNGGIVEWDGYSQTYLYIHDAQSISVLSGVDYYGIPVVVNNRGLILEYNGNSFVPMVRNGQRICFPSYEEFGNSFVGTELGSNAIAPRGMAVTDDGLIYINVRQPITGSCKQLAGIWCLNPMEGRIYSKYSLGVGGDSSYGEQFTGDPGAIKSIGASDDIATSSYLLASVIFNPNYGTSINNGIFALHRDYSSTVRRGHFITQFIHSDNIQERWDVIWTEINKFKSTNDKIIVKAKGCDSLLNSKKRPLEATITWTSTTTFTLTLNANDDSLQKGDEVEVLAGKNAGVLAHITDIAGNHGALQTITIDETVVTNSLTSLGRFDRWKKLGVITDTSKYIVPTNIGINSSFIQFKLEVRGIPGDFNIKSLTADSVKETLSKK